MLAKSKESMLVKINMKWKVVILPTNLTMLETKNKEQKKVATHLLYKMSIDKM